MGRIIPYILWKIKNVWNHQPDTEHTWENVFGYISICLSDHLKKPSTLPFLCLSQVFVWNMSSASIAFQDCNRIDYGAEIGCWLLLFQKSTCEPSWELTKLFLLFDFHGFVANRWFCRKFCSDKLPIENELPSSVALPWSAPAISASFKVGETILYPKLWPTSMVKMTVNGKPFVWCWPSFDRIPFGRNATYVGCTPFS